MSKRLSGSEMLGSIDVLGTQRYVVRQRRAPRVRCLIAPRTLKPEQLRWTAAANKSRLQERSLRGNQNRRSQQLRHQRLPATGDLETNIKTRTREEIASLLEKLQDLVQNVNGFQSLMEQKTLYLKSVPEYLKFHRVHGKWCDSVTKRFDETDLYLFHCVIAMGQTHVFVNECAGPKAVYMTVEECHTMLKILRQIEKFYSSIGGILGYQLRSLQLISGEEDDGENDTQEDMDYLMPCYVDLAETTRENKRAVIGGIDHMNVLSEIYALGGSGDRLGLKCPKSGDHLPSAMLQYCGRTMLDSMIRDLQAREYLYYKLEGVPLSTPIAIMTSDAKDNDRLIRGMLEARDWYGRGEESFFLFKQPMVPVIDISNGQWLSNAPGKMVMRPGGHGVIWKLMFDEGVFDWLRVKLGRSAAIVRQVSNPMAATDNTLFGLTGVGFSQKHKAMGFASCERVVGASEGMNVIRHTRSSSSSSGTVEHTYGITNIEYTEFERLGLVDVSIDEDSSTSCFPANTNILFVSLDHAESAVKKSSLKGGSGACLPGLIFNKTKKVRYIDELVEETRECFAGRMECMMQNLADSFMDTSASELHQKDLTVTRLSTFMVSNSRRKVTSSAKRKYKPGGSIRQTPEGSFWDLQLNGAEILNLCHFTIPDSGTVEEYLRTGPAFIFLFHPALGPLWSTIAQKLRGGELHKGSELILEISEIFIEHLDLSGSLIIEADNVVGHTLTNRKLERKLKPKHSRLQYSDQVGRVSFQNVTVKNAGIDWECRNNVYWQHAVRRNGQCSIRLHGHSEFLAKNVTISGNHSFEVKDGYQMMLVPDQSRSTGFREQLKKLPKGKATWQWRYQRINDEDINLTMVE